MSAPAPIATRRFLTPAHVAAELGVKVERVIAWIRSGQLRGVNLGDGLKKPRFRIAPADLEVFLLARTVQPPTPTPRRRRADPGVIAFF
jgi:hypothetical protein